MLANSSVASSLAPNDEKIFVEVFSVTHCRCCNSIFSEFHRIQLAAGTLRLTAIAHR